jgi:hypothetical protein
LETGIQNGPLGDCDHPALTFPSPTNNKAIMAVPALYSLFIVITSTLVTHDLPAREHGRRTESSPTACFRACRV